MERHEQVNTGWLPTASNGAVLMRPVPLLPIADLPPLARYASPLPRYGSNVQGFGDMPLLAPVEQTSAPVEPSSVSLIDEMFLPPEMETETPDSVGEKPVAAVDDPVPPVVNQGTGSTLQAPEPLPPVAVSEVGLVAPTLAAPDVVVPLPPVEPTPTLEEEPRQVGIGSTALENLGTRASDVLVLFPPVEAGLTSEKSVGGGAGETPGVQDSVTGELLVPLPPVEAGLPSEVETSVAGGAGETPGVQNSFAGELLVPLPPVDSRPNEPVAGTPLPELVPLPPVEPRLLPAEESTALRMIEGLFEPIPAKPAAERELEAGKDPDSGSAEAGVLERSAEGEASVDLTGTEEVLRPLPPVELSEGCGVSQSALADGGGPEAEKNGRSWELELIARQADEHARQAFELAGKKAYFAARREFMRALRVIAQGLDRQYATNRHSRALAAGVRALNEAEDFLPKDGHLEAELDLAVIAGAHGTPVLHGSDVQQLTPLGAIQKYHTYAQEQLATAVGNEVAGSMALGGLGKLYVAIGDQQRGDGIVAARTKAMVVLQAALVASPANHMASNELGVLFARNGRHTEARAAFQYSVAAFPTEEGWRNLALTCERLGEMDLAYRAAQESLALRDRTRGNTPLAKDSSLGAVRWVSPGELAGSGGNLRTASAAGGGAAQAR